MNIVNIVTLLCYVYMIGLVAIVLARALSLDKLGRVKFFKNFKKGKFIWIYFVAIPIYMLGMSYDGGSGLGMFLDAVANAVEIVVLKYKYEAVVNLAEANAFYMGAVYLCFALVAINAGMFTFAIFGERAMNGLRLASVKRSGRVYVLVGYNERTRMIIDSIVAKNNSAQKSEKFKIVKLCEIGNMFKTMRQRRKAREERKNRVVLFANVDGDTMDELYAAGVAVVKFKQEGLKAKLEKLCVKFEDKTVNVILNEEDDVLNLVYCEELSQIVEKTKFNSWSIDNPKGIIAYVFGEEQNEYAFIRLVEKTKGCVRYVNKYKLVAMDFLDRYPLTRFMDEEHIDYSTATIRPDVDVNVVMIGFGKTGQQLFLTSVQNNQFLTIIDGEVVQKKVDYFIYDKLESENDKNLNHNYYRYSKEFLSEFPENASPDYLPFPEEPANVSFTKIDINDKKFYERLKGNLTAEESHKAINSVIIAFGSDLDNLDLAEKVAVKLKEWGFDGNTKVFVKIRNDDLYDNVLASDYEKKGEFIVFGGERNTVYNVDKVVNHEVDILARRRHVCYETEYADANKTVEEIEKDALVGWYSNPQFKRESNVYASMSIRMKLNLMGYDYAYLDLNEEDKTEEFFNAYQKDDEIVYQLDGHGEIKKLQDKKMVDYGDCNFKRNTIRNNYAVQEHARWNAYMICCGFIPASIEEIKEYLRKGNKSDFEKYYRKHGNLTTYDGLITYKKIKSEITGEDLSKSDIIKYDYQILDDVKWLLGKRGCKVVKAKKN